MQLRPRKVTPLAIPQGATWSTWWPILWSGQRRDLTGWTVRAQVRAELQSATVLHEFSTALGSAAAVNGYVGLLSTPESMTWTWTEGVYQVIATDPDDQVLPVAEGPIFVRKALVRDE